MSSGVFNEPSVCCPVYLQAGYQDGLLGGLQSAALSTSRTVFWVDFRLLPCLPPGRSSGWTSACCPVYLQDGLVGGQQSAAVPQGLFYFYLVFI